MDRSEDATQPIGSDEAELKELLGLFTAPAFARRGADLEYALARLRARCRRERDGMLDMVRLRLRQWASAVDGPDAWRLAFDRPIDDLWTLSGAEPPRWGTGAASLRRLRAIARDLVASLDRFNRRWSRFVLDLKLDALNASIEQYNQNYPLEKECVLGSARLAHRLFQPKARLSQEGLLAEFPPLPVPGLVDRPPAPAPPPKPSGAPG